MAEATSTTVRTSRAPPPAVEAELELELERVALPRGCSGAAGTAASRRNWNSSSRLATLVVLP
jgi:hypothetical protein